MNTENERITIGTLARFLMGSRDAILSLAATPRVLWLGAIFVLSAGLARDYDGAYLLAEPWWLAVPFVASLVTSFLLYFIVRCVGVRWSGAFWRTYRSFLALYWLTAPLAWLYAVPVERFLSAYDAALANIIFLGAVSVWRVGLMTRIINVLFEAPKLSALWVVLFFADTLAIVLLFMAPIPIIQIMGGVRLSDREALIQSVAINLGFFAIVTWLVWFAGVTMIAVRGRRWNVGAWRKTAAPRQISAGLWAFAATSVLVWLLVLPTTQVEQRLSWEVEKAYEEGRLDSVVELMSQHAQADFPPHWDPPPRIAYGESRRLLFAALNAASKPSTAPWVRAAYADKLDRLFDWEDWFYFEKRPVEGLLEFLGNTAEGQQLLVTHAEDLSHHLESIEGDDLQTTGYRDRLQSLLQRVEVQELEGQESRAASE